MWGCWCDLLLSCCCSKAKRIACSRTCLLTCSAPQAENFGISSSRYDLQLESTYARAAVISGCRRPRWRRALLDAVLLPRALLRFSLFVPISASRFRRTSARASRSLSGSLEQRTNQQCSPQELLGFLLKTFFFPLPLPGAAGFKNMAPPIRAEVLRVLY